VWCDYIYGNGAQILEIQERHVFIGGAPKQDVEDALLGFVELHQPRQQQRPHILDGGPDRVTLLAKQIPKQGWKGDIGPVVEPDLFGALDEALLLLARGGNTGKIALDVGGKYRHPGAGKAFGQNLQGDGLAGAGGAGDEAVPVGEPQLQVFRLDAAAEEDLAVLERRLALTHGLLLNRSGPHCRRPFQYM